MKYVRLFKSQRHLIRFEWSIGIKRQYILSWNDQFIYVSDSKS